MKIPKIGLAPLIILLGISFLINLGLGPLYFEEPRRALVGMEMVMSGNYITPTIMGQYYYNKPPLFNWFIALGYKLTGSYSEWIPRLVSIMSFWLFGLVNYFFVAKNFNKPLAIWSSILLLISVDIYFFFSTLGEIDLFYALLSFGSIAAILHGFWHNKNAFYLLAYTLAGFGFLTKGFPSPIFLGATLFAIILLSKSFKVIFKWHHLIGGVLFLAVVGGYFLWYHQYNNAELFIKQIFSQSSDRTADKTPISVLLSHLVFYPFDTLKNLLPAGAAVFLFTSKSIRKKVLEHKKLALLLLVFLLNYIVYWVSPGSRARYVYMLYPLAIIALTFALQIFLNGQFKGKKAVPKILGVLFIIAAIAVTLITFDFDVLPLGNKIGAIVLALALVTIGVLIIKPNHSLLFYSILAFVLVRIWFDLTILENRATEGPRHNDFLLAKQIVKTTENGRLHFVNPKYPGAIPLETIFYIQKSKNEILTTKPIDCNNFFWLNNAEVDNLGDKAYTVHHQFNWRRINYKIVTLNCD